MEANEFKAILEEVSKANGKAIADTVKEQVKMATEGLMPASLFTQKLEEAGIKADSIKKLEEAIEKQGLEMRKLFDAPMKAGKSLDEMIIEKKDEILALKDTKTSMKFNVNKTQVTRSGVQSTTMAMRLAEVGEQPYLGAVMRGLFRTGRVSPSSNGVIRYYDQNTVTRNAAFTAEGATKPESAINWVERTCLVEKIADSIPVTKEAWNDVYFIQSEINRLLNVNLALNEDAQLWDGDGNTPNIKGVYTSAYAFDYVGDAITRANIFDLAAQMKVDITNNRQSKYMPNVLLINPADSYKLKTTKLTDGQYVMPSWGNTATIDGMRVVESSQVTQNTMLVGDFNYGTLYDLDDITVEVGWINDQFIKNAMTILAERRLALLVRNVDAYAFCKCTDIDAALLQLTNGAS